MAAEYPPLPDMLEVLAPDTNLFAEIEPLFGYFVGRYPNELSQIMATIND